LISIWLDVAKNNPAADRVLDAIERRWQQLADFPYSGISREDIAPEIRHLVAGQYLVLYRIMNGAIEVARIPHDRRHVDQTTAE
jgi:toxin ParE1/3/4